MKKTTQFLVTFCNQENPFLKTNVAYIDVEKKQSILLYTNNVRGFTGIGYNEKYIFILSQDKNLNILILDKKNGEIIHKQLVTEISDQHSLIVKENTLYIVSTGNDSVLEYIFDESKKELHFQKVLWTPQGSEGKIDTHHINSIFEHNGDVYVSAFGEKNSETWKSAKNGYIYNITKNHLITEIDPIYHPHSLIIENENFYYCESSTRSIKRNNETILQLEKGYIRGLAVTDQYMVVGSSRGRKKSKSTGIINNITEEGEIEESCSVFIYDKESKKLLQEHSFLPEQQEIYEIIPFDGVIDTQEYIIGKKNIFTELERIEKNSTEKDHTITTLSQEITKKDQAISTLSQEITKKDQAISTLSQEITEKDHTITTLSQEIEQMKESKFWKLRDRYIKVQSLFRKNT